MVLNSLRKHDNLKDRLRDLPLKALSNILMLGLRLWIVDEERTNLLLKFSAGKYKNIYGEFSKVSINSIKIGRILDKEADNNKRYNK